MKHRLVLRNTKHLPAIAAAAMLLDGLIFNPSSH